MKIEIDNKLISAINKILIEFSHETDGSELKTPEKWINWTIEYYIRNMFTNGDDYIDRD